MRRILLGAQAVLFCQRTQQLFELNPTADLIWRGLAEGLTPQAVARELTVQGVPDADARQFVAVCAAEWIAAGRMTPEAMTARLAAPATGERQLRLGPLHVRLALHLSSGDPIQDQIRAAFDQFAAAPSEPDLRLAVVEAAGAYGLWLDEAPLGVLGPERIVSEVKAVLTDQLSRAVGGGAFLLHAGLLASRRRGLILSGQPGAGKTTLTLALASRGLGYGSDDIIRVFPDGRLEGVPFSPASKSGAWSLLPPYVPAIADLPVQLRADGQQVRYVPTAGLNSGEVDSLGWVLLLARRPGARASFEPVEPLEALGELLGGAFAADRRMEADTLAAFAGLLSAADCRRLVYADLAEAVAAVEALVGA